MTAIMSCLITGCGGGGHHSSNNESNNSDAAEVTPTPPSETPTSPSETPSETIAQQNSKLEVQVIDGYLTDLDVCIVNDKLECNDVFGKARTDENGKASFDLNDEQKKILTQMKSVKFKAVAKKGTTDIILGKKTENKNDMVLLGTKFFESGELNSKPDKKKSFKLTPFTTMAEMIHSGKVSNKDEYEETLKQIAESLKTDLDTIQSDYNNTEGDNKDQNIAALLGGELMAALNMLPKTINEIATTKDKDEFIKITLKSLETIKELADGLKEKLLGIDGNIKNDIDLIEILNDKLKVLNSSFVSISSGHADEWRCGVTKANEVWCWGNNAWNNLGNQEFTQNKLNVEKYSIANTDELMYLKNNYTAKPIPVLIKNPDKKTDEDPEYIHLSGITKVAVGTSHGCAITLNREVYCWGGNYHGQLGIGKEGYMNTYKEPVGYASKVVAGKQNSKSEYLSNVADLSLGRNYSCALTAEGDIYCWGDNTAYELGAAHENDRMLKPIKTMSQGGFDISEYLWEVPYPVKVPAPDGVKFSSITQSGSWAVCALSTPETTDREGHNLWCWGNDIAGLITGNNKQYAQKIDEEWVQQGKISQKIGENPVYYSSTDHETWYYRQKNGDFYPMFGQPITNVKSYTFSSTTFGMKNIKTIDIADFDSLLFFTTTETADKLYQLYASNLLNNEGSAWIVASEFDLHNEKIRNVHLGVEAFGGFIITEEGNLYGYGRQIYGTLGNGNKEGFSPMVKITIDKNRPDLQVQTLSANKRSVCASVKDQNAEDPDKLELYCWGSSTFGQLGFDNGDNDFSYGDISTQWNDYQNELMDKPSRIQTTPKQVLTDFTFDD